jgi:GT2 family glycosyltransferase
VLEALAHQDYPADAFEVIVVLDGSSDESAELAARASTPYRLRILEQRRTGTAAARNRGAREAASPLLVFLDDDIIPEPQFLSEHARAHADGHPQRVALGACPSAPLGRGRWGRMQRAWWENHFARKGDPDLPWTAIEASMGNSSLPRSFLEACGGFDERFARRNEDVELGARLIGAGASFAYRPQARGAHVLDGTLKTALMRHREQAYYDVLLIRKHPELRSRVAAAAYASDSPAGVSRAAAAAYRHAAVLAPLQPLALAAAALLEGLRMRRTFDALAGRLMAQSYMAGLRRAPGTAESFAELMAWIRAEPEARLSLELGAPGPLEVPAGIGRASLAITHGPKTLAEVQLMEPGRDWSWDELTTRAASELLGPVRSSMPLEELIRMAAPDDSTPASGGRSA